MMFKQGTKVEMKSITGGRWKVYTVDQDFDLYAYRWKLRNSDNESFEPQGDRCKIRILGEKKIYFQEKTVEGKVPTEDELVTLKKIVLGILEEDERSRNSDLWLILKTLRSMNFKVYVDYTELKDMPSFESITRCRRLIQNKDGQFPPTDPKVIERRRLREEKFRTTINKI